MNRNYQNVLIPAGATKKFFQKYLDEHINSVGGIIIYVSEDTSMGDDFIRIIYEVPF